MTDTQLSVLPDQFCTSHRVHQQIQ